MPALACVQSLHCQRQTPIPAQILPYGFLNPCFGTEDDDNDEHFLTDSAKQLAYAVKICVIDDAKAFSYSA
jgi:hypothetical protein